MRTSRYEQDQIIAQWQASGLSMAAFARQERVAYHCLVYWVGQRRRSPSGANPVDEYFEQVTVPPGCQGGHQPVTATLRLRHSAELIFDGVSPSFVAALVREVNHD